MWVWRSFIGILLGLSLRVRITKKRSKVQVYTEALPEGKKYTYRVYRFNRTPDRFESPFISWANLDCCNGWEYDEAYLDTAVQEGRKLYAGRSAYVDEQPGGHFPTRREAAEEFAKLCSRLPEGVVGAEERPGLNARVYATFICRCGRIADYYDLDAVFAHYGKLGVVLSAEEQAQIWAYCQMEIQDFGTEKAPFDYRLSETREQLAATGLLLGYPLESTASLLME